MNTDAPKSQGLGESQRLLIELLRRLGPSTLGDLVQRIDLTMATVREHLHVLLGRGLVRKAGRRRGGPGRPSTVYALTPAGEEMFPLREYQLLQRLVVYLDKHGPASSELLKLFFADEATQTYEASHDRLDGLTGRPRLAEVARIMTERGFMAEIDDSGDRPRLRICNCPLRHIVEVSRLPCHAEIGLVRRLLGEEISRETFMPDGDHTCTYAADNAKTIL